MDRAGKLLAGMKIPGGPSGEDLARAAWPHAVGKVIASHTRAASLHGSCLLVEVEDNVWKGQLIPLRTQILANLRKFIGAGIVESLELRLRIPRLPPQRAERPQPSGDEADGIGDPVLRHIYRASRKKSLA